MGYGDSGGGTVLSIKPFGAQVYNAMESTGTTSTQKIQNTLDISVSGHKFVVIPPGSYTIDPIKLSSNTTLILYGAKLTLSNGANERIITNADHVNGNQNVYIYGFGDSELNGNVAGQVLPGTPYKNIGVHFYKVDYFGVSHVKISSTMRWALVPEACTYGMIEDITFQLEGAQNQDGIHILGPSNNIQVSRIRGTFGDDACVVNARPSTGGTGAYQGEGTGGSITNVTFKQIHVKGVSSDGQPHTSILRTSVGGSNLLSGVILDGAVGENILSIARLGGDAVPAAGMHRDITIDNVHVESGFSELYGQGVHILRDVTNLKIHNISTAPGGRMALIDNFPTGWSGGAAAIDGLLVSDCLLEATVVPSANDGVIKFKGASVKNARFTNVSFKGMVGGGIGYKGITVADTVLENVNFNISLKDMLGIMKTSGTTTMKNVQITYKADNMTSNQPWELAISQGLTVTGSDTADRVYKPSGTVYGTFERFKKVIDGLLRFTSTGANPTGLLLNSGDIASLKTGNTLVIEVEGKFFGGSGFSWFSMLDSAAEFTNNSVTPGYTLYMGGSALTLYRGNSGGIGTQIGTFATSPNYANTHKVRVEHTSAGVITIFLDGAQMFQVTDTNVKAGLFAAHAQAGSGTMELTRLEYAYI